MNRRDFLGLSLGVLLARSSGGLAAPQREPVEDRIRGLVLGSALGDALGGPIEFQDPDEIQRLDDPPKRWKETELMDAPARAACARRLRLRSYEVLRPAPESYGQWNRNAAPGTVTDDTRHKLVLLHALRQADADQRWPLNVRGLAQAYLDWPGLGAITRRPEYQRLAADWLEEWQLASRWILGERELGIARPPERMWQGLPTCCGQMTLLPLAALYPGRPVEAYRAAWALAFFDNGYGRDMNASLVAGLAQALVAPSHDLRAGWDQVLNAVRRTDPFEFGKIRWTERAVARWLDFALKAVADAKGHPARMFAAFEKEFYRTTKWEAQVPFVLTFGCLAMADYDPLAALELSLEWGHDSDSYAQLLGAFVGALHGADLFPEPWRRAVTERVRQDFDVDLEEEIRFLGQLRRLSETRGLVGDL